MELAQTIRNIMEAVISPKFNTLDRLNELTLSPLTFVRPTVDGHSFLPLHNIGGRWGHRLAQSPSLGPIQHAIDNLIQTSTEVDDNYDFSEIQSISAGKSLMNGSASRYEDVLDWGNHMRSADNIGFETDEQFDKNLNHVKHRMLHSEKGLRLEVFEWHHDRNCVINNDGSHHAAAVVRQLNKQDRKYTCTATITRYSIDSSLLTPLSNDFYLVLADDNCFNNEGQYYLSLAMSNMNIEFATLDFPRPGKSYRLFAIPKEQAVISTSHLKQWVRTHFNNKTMINFFEFARYPAHTMDPHLIDYSEEHKLD